MFNKWILGNNWLQGVPVATQLVLLGISVTSAFLGSCKWYQSKPNFFYCWKGTSFFKEEKKQSNALDIMEES